MDEMKGASDERLPGISIEDLLAGASFEAPALSDDPAARLLGLVPDAALRFDGAALKRARNNAGVLLPELVRQLRGRGWEVSNGDLFGWESGRSGAIAPALIAAVAELVRVPQAALAMTRRTGDRLNALRTTEKFGELVERLSSSLSLPLALARARLETAAAVAVHRGDVPEVEVALRSLEALVEEIEGRSR